MRVEPALVVVAGGDHGVVEEGVSAFPQEVTGQMLRNILEGGAGISVLSRLNGMEMIVVDAGGAHDALNEEQYPRLKNLRLGRGTANLARECAMSAGHCVKALEYGMDTVRYAAEQGIRLVLADLDNTLTPYEESLPSPPRLCFVPCTGWNRNRWSGREPA